MLLDDVYICLEFPVTVLYYKKKLGGELDLFMVPP